MNGSDPPREIVEGGSSAEPTDRLLDGAYEAAELGRLDDAEALCRQILAREPRHFEALLLLATLSGRTGRTAQGIQYLQEALAVDPQSFDCHLQLGGFFRQEGRIPEAMTALEAAVRLEPDNGAAHHDLGVLYLETGRWPEARMCFERACGLGLDLAIVHFHRGLAIELQGLETEAVAPYRRALELDPNLADAQARLGFLLVIQGRATEAQECFQRAVAIAPDSVPGRLSQARLLFDADGIAEAELCLRQAIEFHPQSSELHCLLGNVLTRLGRFDEAVAASERAIALNGRHAAAYFDLVNAKTLTKSDRPLIARMEALLREAAIGDAMRISLHFALGKAYDDLAEYEAAIGHFDEANRLKGRTRRLDREKLARLVQQSIAGFTRDFFARTAATGSDSELPIFIVGMPRSGTTLVEQIISSHPDVGAGDELPFWHEAMAALGHVSLKRWDAALVSKLADDYLSLLRGIAPNAKRVTDKLPDNFLRAGIIHAVFPRARIIHCRRHPVDTSLSIYFTNFHQGISYANDRDSIAVYYEHYRRLMAHWRKLLPPEQFREVEYERLIGNTEQVTRELIAFCGLDWNESCLRHQDNPRTVKTASMWQARQPIYKSSVARWKRYEPWLGELRRLMPAPPD